MILTYKYRLLPTKRQHSALMEICESQRILYNAALEERIGCYKKTGKGRSFYDQQKALTECRKALPDMAAIPANLQRWTLKRLDDAYAGFFRRLKTNGKAGFPRFRSKSRWNSFGFAEFSGISLKDKRLRFKGLPSGIRVHFHRALPDNADIRSCVFRRDDKGWFVCLQVEVAAAEKRAVTSSVGVDLGLKVFAYQSDNVIIPNPRIARRAEKQMRLRARALSRCQRGSNRRKKVKSQLTRLHAKIANTRNTWLHQQSARLVNGYDLIVAEDLRVANMVKHPTLARSIADASWSKFLSMVAYKAEYAGKHFITVNPKNTSQKCSGCHELVPKSLAARTHSCPHCGLVIDRDYNASLNILNAAVVSGGGRNVTGYGKRAPGNISLD